MAVYAKDVNNLTLLGEIDFELTDLIKGKDADLEAKWLLVFQRAAERETATASLAREVAAMLERARTTDRSRNAGPAD